MVFTDKIDNGFVHETVKDGVVFSLNNGAEYQLLIPGAQIQEMTLATYADMSPGTDYNSELCEKYGLSNANFSFRTFIDGNNRSIHLFASSPVYDEGGTYHYAGETEIDDNFTPRTETITTDVIVLTQSGVIEIQHEGSTAEEVTADIESAGNLLNQLITSRCVIFTESASA